MNEDIGPILEGWPYEEGSNVRRIVGADDTEKVQIRVVLQGFHGILQFNCDGRPDGKHPHGREFALDHYEEMLRRRTETADHPGKFSLTHAAAEELFEESSIVYQRYAVLLQMSDYRRVIRDTSRNVRLFRFVHEHAAEADDRDHLEKWWPYIIRIHHTARVLLHLEEGKHDEAAGAVERARRELAGLTPQEDEVFKLEMERSQKALDELDKAVRERRPVSPLEQLEREKAEAVRKEDYERAAELRDRIERMKQETRRSPPPGRPQ